MRFRRRRVERNIAAVLKAAQEEKLIKREPREGVEKPRVELTQKGEEWYVHSHTARMKKELAKKNPFRMEHADVRRARERYRELLKERSSRGSELIGQVARLEQIQMRRLEALTDLFQSPSFRKLNKVRYFIQERGHISSFRRRFHMGRTVTLLNKLGEFQESVAAEISSLRRIMFNTRMTRHKYGRASAGDRAKILDSFIEQVNGRPYYHGVMDPKWMGKFL